MVSLPTWRAVLAAGLVLAALDNSLALPPLSGGTILSIGLIVAAGSALGLVPPLIQDCDTVTLQTHSTEEEDGSESHR